MLRSAIYLICLFSFVTNYIIPCSAKDPNLNECAKKHGQESLQDILKGDPKYKIPNMTPLNLPEIMFTSGNLSVHLENVVVLGLEYSKIKEINMDLSKRHISVAILIDNVNLISDYNINGSILILPITGNGRANITFVGGEYRFDFDYVLNDKRDGQYMEIMNDTLTYKTKRSYYHFENLFGGNRALGEHMNTFLNEHWEDVQDDIGPALTKTISAIVKATLGGVISRVPFQEMFRP
ncbi:hypothetical protein RI129_001451 [Pyrocoelia pectoralis]|uniref:Protein takeout-like n=1 Tax=Pyrocoelia pectoralis TaxID=417401 RepID=A0AAN7ZPQ0_9COLE